MKKLLIAATAFLAITALSALAFAQSATSDEGGRILGLEKAWNKAIEVKDTKGAVVLSTIGYPGATHAVSGAAPFEVILGNAEAVTVTWRGAPFDSTPYVKQNVAKFTIK